MSAEVRQGYKLTEAGVIPEEWDSSSMLSHLKEPIRNGYSPRCPETPTGTWILSLSAVGFDGFNPNGIKPAPKNDPKIEQNLLRPQDIVISRSNTRDRVGLAGIYEGDPAPCAYPDLLMRIRVSDSLEPKFLLKQILSDRGRQYFSESARGSSGSMVKIDRGILESFPVSVPSISEQRAITLALSDMDALLNNIDQLIAKKRDIQQAAMQQILTGQRRLPGFSDEWEVANLGEISFISKGEQLSQRGDATGLVPHFNGGVSASSYTDTANTPKDTIAISEGGNSCGFVQFITTPFWCGGHCYAVRPRGIENLFLYFALKGKQDSIMGLRVGSGLPNIQKSALNSFQIALPSNRDEQTAIATILSDMDTELAALETRQDKARQLKQGMMQELLTGGIRLPCAD